MIPWVSGTESNSNICCSVFSRSVVFSNMIGWSLIVWLVMFSEPASFAKVAKTLTDTSKANFRIISFVCMNSYCLYGLCRCVIFVFLVFYQHIACNCPAIVGNEYSCVRHHKLILDDFFQMKPLHFAWHFRNAIVDLIDHTIRAILPLVGHMRRVVNVTFLMYS